MYTHTPSWDILETQVGLGVVIVLGCFFLVGHLIPVTNLYRWKEGGKQNVSISFSPDYCRGNLAPTAVM